MVLQVVRCVYCGYSDERPHSNQMGRSQRFTSLYLHLNCRNEIREKIRALDSKCLDLPWVNELLSWQVEDLNREELTQKIGSDWNGNRKKW